MALSCWSACGSIECGGAHERIGTVSPLMMEEGMIMRSCRSVGRRGCHVFGVLPCRWTSRCTLVVGRGPRHVERESQFGRALQGQRVAELAPEEPGRAAERRLELARARLGVYVC